MEKKLLEAVEKSRAPPPSAPKEKLYVPPPPEEHHYYYCEFPPEAELQTQVNAVGHWNPNGNWIQGKLRDAPWRDHPNFRWSDQNQSQLPQPSTQQIQPSEGQPNWPARNKERPNNGGNIMQGGQANWSSGPQDNWSSGHQGNWSSGGQPNWSGRHQGPQSSSSGRQPNNQVVSYVPPHQMGNQQYPGNQQYHQPQYQLNHYGPSDYPQISHGGGPSNQRYNRHPNEGSAEMMVSHQPNDAMREIQEAQKEQRAMLDMLTKQLSQVARSLGELRGNEGKIPATVQQPGCENISEVSLRSGKVYQSPSPPAVPPVSKPGSSQEEEGESSSPDRPKGIDKGKKNMGGETSGEGQGEEADKVKPYPYRRMVTMKRDATIDVDVIVSPQPSGEWMNWESPTFG
ncbi:glutenin, high molecular weight subunit DY10-like [Salvia splendens]|uniref:glutenin, high molecular weight subunit DY10-like n=1 Tax=Salvia splendens TaxID=180675 RepID=UPI001C261ECC|nr:glutenin, high molecular weight subunit DY10-like [Salvia splendens]